MAEHERHGVTFTPATSIFVQCEAEAEIDRLFARLSKDGVVLMELDRYPFSPEVRMGERPVRGLLAVEPDVRRRRTLDNAVTGLRCAPRDLQRFETSGGGAGEVGELLIRNEA